MLRSLPVRCLFICLLISCAPEPLHTIDVVPLDSTGLPGWAKPIAMNAIYVWDDRGVEFELADSGTIHLGETGPRFNNLYYEVGPDSYILISDIESEHETCVLVRNLGYAIGRELEDPCL